MADWTGWPRATADLSGHFRKIPGADIRERIASDADGVADHVCCVRYRVSDQMSIFSAVSMASSSGRYADFVSVDQLTSGLLSGSIVEELVGALRD